MRRYDAVAGSRAHLEGRARGGLAAGLAVQIGDARDEGVKVAVRKEAGRPALVHVEEAAEVVCLVATALALLTERLLKGAEDMRDACLRLHAGGARGDRPGGGAAAAIARSHVQDHDKQP